MSGPLEDGALEACPFCGSAGEAGMTTPSRYRPGCTKCSMVSGQSYETEQEAVAYWNRRPWNQTGKDGWAWQRDPAYKLQELERCVRNEMAALREVLQKFDNSMPVFAKRELQATLQRFARTVS